MRDEGFDVIKTSGIDPLRYYDIFEILSLPVQNYNFLWKDLIISGDRSNGQDKNLIKETSTKTNLVPRIYPAGLYSMFSLS